jgi:hypothetical protein
MDLKFKDYILNSQKVMEAKQSTTRLNFNKIINLLTQDLSTIQNFEEFESIFSQMPKFLDRTVKI